MADKVIQSLVYKLIADEADLVKSLKASEKRLDALGDKFISAGKKATLGLTVPIVAIGTAMVAAAMESEKATKLLENAIQAAGNQGKVSAKNLSDYAGQLQLISVYDDEATMSAFTLLEQMTALDEDGLKALMPSIQNLASALDMDLQSATSLVGKSIGTNTNALGRYGIEVDTGASKSEKMAQVLKGLAKYAGAAGTEAGTFEGKLKILKNQVGDLAEQFGNELLPIISEVVGALSGAVKQFASMSDEQKRAVLATAAVAAAIGPMLIGIGNAIKMVSTLKVVMTAMSGPAGWVTLAAAAVIALGIALATTIKKNVELQKIYSGDSTKPFEQQLALVQEQAKKTDEEYKRLTKNADELFTVQKDKNKELQRLQKLAEIGGQAGFDKEKARLEGIQKIQAETIDGINKKIKENEDAQDDLNGTNGVVTGGLVDLTAAQKAYAEALEMANGAIQDSTSEEQKLLDKIVKLDALNTKSAEDENTRIRAIAALRKQLFQIRKNDEEEAGETERAETQKTHDYINAKIEEYRAAKLKEVTDAEEQAAAIDKIEKDKIESTSGYVEAGLNAVSEMSKIMQTDLSESWDDLAEEVLNITSEIGKATGTQEGMIVAAVADGLNLIVDLIDSAINYEETLARNYASTINDVNVSILDNKIEQLDKELEATLKTIDAEEQAALASAGLLDDTEVQALQKKLEEETDLEKKAELEKELAKAKIQEEYQKKRDDAEAAADKAKRKLEYDRAVWEKKIMLAKIAIEQENAISELGWFNADKKSAVRSLYADLISSVNSIPLPALAGGGSFTVPAGFENDSFPITTAMAQSGERITVETPEQQAANSGATFQIGTVIADPSGLRELERLLNKYGTIETQRRG